MLTARLPRFAQVEKDPRRAVDTVTRRERDPDQPEQPRILLCAVRQRLLELDVVPTRGNAEDPTHELHGKLIVLRLNKRVRATDSSSARILGHRPPPPWFLKYYGCPLKAGNSKMDIRCGALGVSRSGF